MKDNKALKYPMSLTLRGKVFVPLPLFFELKALQTLGKEVFYGGY